MTVSSMSLYRRQNGFTMIEMLLTLLVVSLCSVLLTYLIRFVQPERINAFVAEDKTAILQLQLLMAQAKEYEVTAKEIHALYHGEWISIEIDFDRVVRRPGYEIFLQEVEDAYFYEEKGCAGLHWGRKDEEQKALIACE